MNCFHYTPGYLSLSRKNLSWHKNNFHSFPHISLLSTLALLKNWGIVFLPAAPRPAFSSNHTPQSVGRKLTTLRERTVRIRKVVGSIPIRSTKMCRQKRYTAETPRRSAVFLLFRRTLGEISTTKFIFRNQSKLFQGRALGRYKIHFLRGGVFRTLPHSTKTYKNKIKPSVGLRMKPTGGFFHSPQCCSF